LLIVHHDELSTRERAVLFALLSQSRKLSNAELEALIGIRLDGRERRRLNDLKLVDSDKPGREFVHELSDVGWRWCAEELASAGPQHRGTSLERSHYLVFAMFARQLDAAGLSIGDLASMRPEPRREGRHVRRTVASGGSDLPAAGALTAFAGTASGRPAGTASGRPARGLGGTGKRNAD
jgi:hypothetical protein